VCIASTVGSMWSTVLSQSSVIFFLRYVRAGPLNSSHKLMIALTPSDSSVLICESKSGACPSSTGGFSSSTYAHHFPLNSW